MRKSLLGPVGLSLLFAALPLLAAELGEVVVTANRTAQSLDTTLAATTVITRAQIESMQARSVEDLLQGVDGLTMGNSGGAGKLTSFFVRGTNADHLLVLINGIKIGSATAGTAALQNLPVEMIERIEFVRGPRSSLYGSEAIGGVLQIFTRRGSSGLQPELGVSSGTYDTRQVVASLSGGGEQSWFSVQGSAQSTAGFDACRGSSTQFAGCFTEEPDRDGYRYRSVALRAGGKFGAATSLEANLLRAASRVEFDGSYANNSQILQQVAGLGLTHRFSSTSMLSLRAGRAWDRSDDYLQAAFQGDFNTRRDSASAQWDVTIARGQVLTVGADYLDDVVSGATDYEANSRHNMAVFAQYVGDHGPWRTELGVRGDDNQQFGSHGTGSLALGYAFSNALQLVMQYGTAFKAPSFNDLYYPFFGNPALDPERSRSVELAAKGRVARARWRVSLFDTHIRDLIGLDSNYLPGNIAAARIRGLEVAALVPWRAWRLDAGLTVQNAENRATGASRGNDLARRPRLAGHLDLERKQGALGVGARLVTEGERFDDASNSRRLAGFGTLDLRADYALGRDWRVQARVANLFDRQHESVAFYNQPGRAYYMTIRYAGSGG
jgi:vitamin B12 transporter